MSSTPKLQNGRIDVKEIMVSLGQGKSVRRLLADGGKVNIDRPVPFLSVYRELKSHPDELSFLIDSNAAYIHQLGSPAAFASLKFLVEDLATEFIDQFGSFLVLELWPAKRDHSILGGSSLTVPAPSFKVMCSHSESRSSLTRMFVEHLSRVQVDNQTAVVEVVIKKQVAPLRQKPLVGKVLTESGCTSLGLEVSPIWLDSVSGLAFPDVKRVIEQQLADAMKKTFYEFAR